MPRGNDAAEASAELQASAADLIAQGGVTTNAERLIDANQARLDPRMTRVSLQSIDEEATAELDLEEVHSAAGLPDDHAVESAAVRGTAVSYVAHDASGRQYKGVYWPEGDEPDLLPDQAVAKEAAQANLEAAAAIAKARADAEAAVEKEKEKIEKKAAKEIAKAQEAAQKKVADASKDAEKAEAKAEKEAAKES